MELLKRTPLPIPTNMNPDIAGTYACTSARVVKYGKQGMERLSVDEMIAALIEREGGFVDHPADRGGPTNFGITQQTLDAWHESLDAMIRSNWPTKVRYLTRDEAALIYKAEYYARPRIDQLPEPWQPLVFDWAVHSGSATAIKELQELFRAIGPDPGPVDGVIGPKTIAAAEAVLKDPLHRYLDRRRRFCALICERDPSQLVFERGWLNRIDELEKSLA